MPRKTVTLRKKGKHPISFTSGGLHATTHTPPDEPNRETMITPEPRVVDEDFARLEGIMKEGHDIGKRDDARRARLGLDSIHL